MNRVKKFIGALPIAVALLFCFSAKAQQTAGAYAVLSGVVVSGVVVTNGGSGYSSVPLVSFVGGGGSGAAVTATISNGIVVAIAVTSGGFFYTSPPQVIIEAPSSTPFGSLLVLDLPINGSVVDAGTNHFTVITNNGGTFITNRFGQPNSAFSLNGVNQNLSLPYNTNLYPDEMTLSLWVNFHQFVNGALWRSGNSTTDPWHGFSLLTEANLGYQDYNGSGYNASLSMPLNNFMNEQWYQIVITRTTNSATMFLNGIKMSSQTNLTPYAKAQVTPMVVGANNLDGGGFFYYYPMALDNVHIYNRALSDAEVQTLYAAESYSTNPPAIASQPVSQTVASGNDTVFTVGATGSALSYQWWHQASEVGGATNATLTLSSVQSSDSGSYHVVVTNLFGSATSSNVTLTVTNQVPLSLSLVLDIPVAGSVVDTGPNHFVVNTNNGGVFTTNRFSQPGSAFSLNGINQAVVLPNNAQLYPEEMTISMWVNLPTITPNGALWRTSNPLQDQYAGHGLGFFDAIGSLNYLDFNGGGYDANLAVSNALPFGQWLQIIVTRHTNACTIFLNGTNVLSQGNLTPYAKPQVAPMTFGCNQNFDASFFAFCQMALDTVHIYNRTLSDREAQLLFRSEASLTNPPVIASQPASQAVVSGNDAVFTVNAFGSPNLSYQWWNEAGAITNATNAILALISIQSSNSGNYYVVVTNLFGSVTSSNALLTVSNQAPFLAMQPTSTNAFAGEDATFTVVAGGSKPISYQWWFAITNINGATNATLTLTNVQTGDAGNYFVVVTNLFGSVTSSNALLTVSNQSPFITAQPLNANVLVGANAIFNVSADGTKPLSYRWRFNGTNIANATNSTLTLSNVNASHIGSYSVQVTNIAGSTLSSNASLTVTFPTPTLRLLNTNAMAGAPVTVPIIFTANGIENTMGFSVSFSTQRLAFASVTWGSGLAGANVFVNTNQVGSGRIGFGVSFPPGMAFIAGTQEVVRINFNSLPLIGTPSAIANNTFGDQPVPRELYNTQLQSLPVTYTSGSVNLSQTIFESDVFPRPNGNQSVATTDLAQMGRFVARLDTATGSEFQRADSAPRTTFGDGQMKVTDLVQTGRYVAGLDPFAAIGGPPNEIAAIPSGVSGSRLLKTIGTNVFQEDNAEVSVILDAQGNENAVGFTLLFNPSAASYSGLNLGSGSTGASLTVNSSQVALGRLGVVLALPTGNTFTAGSKELVRASFVASLNVAGSFPVGLTDDLVTRCVSDPAANELPVSYVAGTIIINPLTELELTISLTGNGVVLSWPLWAADYSLQMLEGSNGFQGSWTNTPATIQTNGSIVFKTLPVALESKFFRLFHP